MDEKKDIELLLERMDSVERLLKLLIVNSILDEANDDNKNKLLNNVGGDCSWNELEEVVASYEMIIIRIENFNGCNLVYIEPNKELRYKFMEFYNLNMYIKSEYSKVIPVFCFDTINGMQRKRFVEENISFYIKDKEIHICSRNK